MVDVSGKVPRPGTYVFIVHYYQPDYPGKLKSLIDHYCIHKVL